MEVNETRNCLVTDILLGVSGHLRVTLSGVYSKITTAWMYCTLSCLLNGYLRQIIRHEILIFVEIFHQVFKESCS